MADAAGTRERIMRGALRCVERAGVSSFSLEDVAREAGVSRTTIYRQFPGGRTQLVEETATWEVARFWTKVAAAVVDRPTLEERLVAGLVAGSDMIRRSTIIANLDEPGIDELAHALGPSQPLVAAAVRQYMSVLLAEEEAAGRLVEGLDVEQAADYLTRMVLSHMAAPGTGDLADAEQARVVVRREFLAGITPRGPRSVTDVTPG